MPASVPGPRAPTRLASKRSRRRTGNSNAPTRSCWRRPRSSRGSSTRDCRGDPIHRRTPETVRGRVDPSRAHRARRHDRPFRLLRVQDPARSARSIADDDLLVEIERVFWDLGRGISGARKIWRLLRREGITVARCTVERLMRRQGLCSAPDLVEAR
ncbi:hypothetical protein DEI86_15545 [Curtobacterium sp. MCBD17_028]|nr:hypothetical protein DEI86_15545 [Curtobacterium sp. MCBD17_028]